jgi:hypothetical protein
MGAECLDDFYTGRSDGWNKKVRSTGQTGMNEVRFRGPPPCNTSTEHLRLLLSPHEKPELVDKRS